MAWNWQEMHAMLMASPVFAAFFCGHDHMGGYREDRNKHFITLEAMLEGEHEGSGATPSPYAVVR